MAIVSTGQLTLTDLNDTKQLILYLNPNYRTQVYNPNSNSYNPNFATSNLVITPELYVAGGNGANIIVGGQTKSVTWYEGSQTSTPISTGVPTGEPSTVAKTLTINSNFTNKNSQIYTCVVVYTDPDTNFDVTLKANVDIVKITNGEKGDSGANAIMAVLDNESHTVPTDSAGNNGNFTGAVSTIKIYEGATDVTSSWSVTQTRSNVTVTEATSSKTATVTAMSADSGYVEFTATRSGYGTIVKRFTLTKNKQGISGTTPTTYWLVNSVPAIAKTKAGDLVPASVTVSGKSQTGTESPSNYSGRYKIYESTDGSAFTVKYTSTGNEASTTYTPSTSSIKALKVELYLAGGTTNKLDEQVIPVVTDGSDGNNGTDAFYLNVWTPEGDTIRNSEGTLKARADLYKGAGVQTSSVTYKWYIQDPSATTSSGGDSDGGNGWRLLNSTYNAGVTGYTSAEITVPSTAIAGVEGFQCVATYGGKKYKNVVILKDFQDPISVNILGANIFKNGEGSVTLKAQLIRAGQEISTSGYTFAWSIYNTNGTLVKNLAGTGDTVTVSASDINGIGNVVCDVSK
jgi:hypothetical protein